MLLFSFRAGSLNKNGTRSTLGRRIQMPSAEQPDQPESGSLESVPNDADFAPDAVYGVKLTKRNIAYTDESPSIVQWPVVPQWSIAHASIIEKTY